MKKVTKILLVVVLTGFGFQSFAQTFGIKAGLNLANISGKEGGEKIEDLKMLMGFNAGITAEFDINEAIAFQTGLTLNTKGTKMEWSEPSGMGDNVDITAKTNVLSLDIPLNIKFNFDKFYFVAGPYLGVALSGKIKAEASYMGETEEETMDIEFGSDAAEHMMKRLDFGLNIGAGVEFGAIGVGVQYGFGLANLVPEGDSDNKINTRTLGISLAYKFGQ